MSAAGRVFVPESLLAGAEQSSGTAGAEQSACRAQLSRVRGSTAPAARATADQLNAKRVTAGPAAGKAALRAPRARESPDRTAERSRER